MRVLLASAISIMAAGAAMPAMAQYYGGGYGDHDGRVVRCESNDGRTRECATGGGRVVLQRQHSRTACIEGRTWGQTRDGVWVSQGCRAEFRVLGYDRGHYRDDGYPSAGSPYGNAYGNTLRCESNDGRVRHCAIHGRGRVMLTRQLSRTACIEGRTWGQDGRSVWVSNGCRAEFRVGRGGWGHAPGADYGNPGYGYGQPRYGYGQPGYGYGGQLFRCESHDGRTRECAANLRGGVQLVRQLSTAPCIQGRTWGYGRSGVWVAEGCRAEFRSY